MTVIDAHQHVWNLEQVRYPWLGPSYGPLFRTYEQDEITPTFIDLGISATVLVQAANSVDETRWMQRVADEAPMVAGILAWVPLDRPDEAARILDDYAGDERIVGIRHLIHEEPDPDWLLQPAVQRGLALLSERALAFDVVAVAPRHLQHVPTLAKRFPALRLVIDHLAKPPIAEHGWQPWAEQLAAAAQYPNVAAKVSGLNTAAALDTWTAADLRPYVEHALAVFGPARLMYGGDWPVTIAGGGYRKNWAAVGELLAELTPTERAQLLGGTAAAVYQLPDQPTVAGAGKGEH